MITSEKKTTMKQNLLFFFGKDRVI